MAPNLKWPEVAALLSPDWVGARTIYATMAGSHLYGTTMPTSDIDIRGVAIAPWDVVLGFTTEFEQATHEDGRLDVVIYDIRKFCRLAADGNPNVLELLFAPLDAKLVGSSAWAQLRDHRHDFLSRRLASKYLGYATSQLQKLYQGKSNSQRGQARQDLVAKYGYDTKNAMHLVRLLRVMYEVLTTGDITVRRPDAAELLAIKAGSWPLAKVETYAAEMMAAGKEAEMKSVLPEKPDLVKLNTMVAELIEGWL